MLDIEIDGLDEVVLGTIFEHRINSNLDEVVVSYDNSATTYIDPNEYHLVSTGIYTGRLEGDVPQWLADYVSDQLSTGGSLDVNPIIDELRDRLANAEDGVNQNLTYIQTADSTLAALETTVVANYNENHAGILNLEQSVATKQEASTLAVDVQQSLFGGDVEAYISSVAATYASANLAYATDYDTLVAAYNDVSASVTQHSEALVEQYENPDWVDDGSQTDPDIYGEPRWIYEARAKHSLEVNADGNIAGFVAEADGTNSEFSIYADIFKVASGSTKLPIFIVDTTPGSEHVEFNSNVAISGDLLLSNTAWVGGGVYSATPEFSWTLGNPPVGFGLSGEGIQDPDNPTDYYNIVGGGIYGGQINGTSMIGGTIIGADLKEITYGSYYTAVYPQSDSTHMIGGYRFGGFFSRTTDASYQYISSDLFGFYSYDLGGSVSDLNRCKSDIMPIDIRVEFSENDGQIYNIGQLEVRSYSGVLLATPISWNFADSWSSQSFTQNGLTFRGKESVTDNLTAISISGVYSLPWSGKSYKDIYLQLVLNDPSYVPDRCVIEATAYTR